MSPPSQRESAFVRYLEQLAAEEDRGALAALRRGLGKPPGEAPELYPYVMPWLGGQVSPWDEDAFFLVASLFGLHQRSWNRPEARPGFTNFGASLARLKDGKQDAAVERRFIALLNAHADDLPEHLRHLVSLLASKETPIDWAQLLNDIRRWDRDGQPVQREWARAFWAGAGPASTSQGDAESVDAANNDFGEQAP
ncbi:MAG: type I-E CRISPR-associated protein Cse2/CasB [Chloroflexi bacterium]|nr:type I-E CRISPR-associated protein Cse2/CasB [Chloroflexota bacterium]